MRWHVAQEPLVVVLLLAPISPSRGGLIRGDRRQDRLGPPNPSRTRPRPTPTGPTGPQGADRGADLGRAGIGHGGLTCGSIRDGGSVASAVRGGVRSRRGGIVCAGIRGAGTGHAGTGRLAYGGIRGLGIRGGWFVAGPVRGGVRGCRGVGVSGSGSGSGGVRGGGLGVRGLRVGCQSRSPASMRLRRRLRTRSSAGRLTSPEAGPSAASTATRSRSETTPTTLPASTTGR